MTGAGIKWQRDSEELGMNPRTYNLQSDKALMVMMMPL
jgi:hypothetical protein